MTAPAVVSFIALSLGEVVRGRGAQVLKSPPLRSAAENNGSEPKFLLQALYKRWFDVSSLARFFVSGNLGNICFFFIERFIYIELTKLEGLPEVVSHYKETVSFFAGYILQIITQHLLHAVLVYGLETINTREKYFKTLQGQFYAYCIALFGSTALNLFLISSGLDKTIAFFSTMVIFACINFYLIGWLVNRALESTKRHAAADEASSGGRRWPRTGINVAGSGTNKAGSKYDERIRRGGAFGSIGAQYYGMAFIASPQSIHQFVLETGTRLEVDTINDQ